MTKIANFQLKVISDQNIVHFYIKMSMLRFQVKTLNTSAYLQKQIFEKKLVFYATLMLDKVVKTTSFTKLRAYANCFLVN